jgi:uncharacterized protein YkwD
MVRRIVAMLLGGALLATFSPATTATAGAGDNKCWNYKPSERSFNRKLYAARTSRGLCKLSLDPEISKVALVHTREMVRKNSLHHTSSSDLSRRVTNWIVLGENVGVGGTVDSLHQAFMNSPSHRDNIEHGAYRHVGIGVRKADGRMWVTVIFEAVTDPGTTLRMPRC